METRFPHNLKEAQRLIRKGEQERAWLLIQLARIRLENAVSELERMQETIISYRQKTGLDAPSMAIQREEHTQN